MTLRQWSLPVTWYTGADPGFGHGGAKISSEGSYIYERSEHKSGGGPRGRCKPPENFFEFRATESESERNLTNYFILFLLLFY